MSNRKIKYLFESLLDKSCFKENRFIFDSTEKPDAKAKAEAEAKAKEEKAAKIEKEAKEKAEKLREEAQVLRKEAGQEVADQNTTEDPIDRDLSQLDQIKFGNFMGNLEMLASDLSASQIDKLVKFAADSGDKKKDNFDKIFVSLKEEKKIIINNSSIDSLKTLLENLDKEKNKDLYEKINTKIQEREEEERKAREKASTTEGLFNAETSADEILEKSIGLVRKGKSVGWTFEIEVDGNKIQSERSFRKSKKFLNAFQKFRDTNKDGVSQSQVKAFCYKWLWEKVYKSGKKTNAIGHVTEFEKSQEMLGSEIKRLGGETPTTKVEAGTDAETESGTDTGKPAEKEKRPPEKEEKTERNEATDDKKTPPKPDYKVAITSTDPAKSEKEEYSTAINDFSKAIKEKIAKGKDAISVMFELTKLAAETSKTIKDSNINEVVIETLPRRIKFKPKLNQNHLGDESILVDIILAIKKQDLGEDSEEYKTFLALTKSKTPELVTQFEEELDIEEYEKNFKKLTTETYGLNLGDISEEDMVKNWKNFEGHKVVERIMSTPPFLFTKEGEIEKKAAAIMAECDNEEIEFEDIFEIMDGFPAIKGKIPQDLLEDNDDFVEEFEKLINDKKAGKLDEKSQQKLDIMFKEILVPCLNLLEALKALKPKIKKPKVASEKTPELPQDQKDILTIMAKLCNFEAREAGGWEKFISWLSGGTGKITMSDIDGKTFTVDKGNFHNKYSANASFDILSNINEDKNKDGELDHYRFENGQKFFNKEAMVNEINSRITLGFINMKLAEFGQKGEKKSPSEIVASEKFKKELEELLIKDFKTINVDQIKAFQLGFVLKESSKFATQVSEIKTALTEGKDKNSELINNHPLFKLLAAKLEEQQISKEKIRKIQEKLLGVAGATFKNGEFDSAILAVPFDIGDGLTAAIGAGATTDGELILGIGLDIKIYKNSVFQSSVILNIGLQGAGAGARQKFEAGPINIHLFEGFQWSWESILPTLGGSFGLSWNMQREYENSLKEAQDKTDFAAAWEEWKKMPTTDIEGKYEKIQKIPQIWSSVSPLVEAYELGKADVVSMLENVQDQIKSETLKDLSSPIPIISYLGFGLMGPIPIPQVGIKLGSAQIAIPNRKAIAKILDEFSDHRVTGQLKDALKALESGKEKALFVEQTGNLIYGRDGKLLNLVKKDQANLNGWENDIESYNQALKRLEMNVKQNENGTVELSIFNTADKDIEIHIDPKLEELGIIKDGSRLILEGNIDDLIITRERFTMPFERTEGAASIRDMILVRQKDSVRGKRNRGWIEKYEEKFLQKLKGEDEFYVYSGNRKTEPQHNILEKAGYSTMTRELMEKASDLISHRTDMKSRVDKKFLDEMTKQVENRKKAIAGVDAEAYEKQKVDDKFFTNLDELFDKNKDFKKDFQAKIDNPEELVEILVEYAKPNNEKEINLGIIHLINRHFTNIYAESTKQKTDKINGEILKHMELKIKWVRDKVFIPKFEAALAAMDPKPKKDGTEMTAAQIVDKIISDTYDPLRAQLRDPNFDFRNLKVDAIPGGTKILSGSRLYSQAVKKKNTEGAIAEAVNYETLSKDKALVHAFGLLEGTTGKYDLNSKNEEEREIARTILQIASPIPKDNLEFLQSPLALRFLALKQTGYLLSYNEDTKFDDHQKISEIKENPAILGSSEAHKQALSRFRNFINEIRETQINGKNKLVKKVGNTGLTVIITTSTDIGRGSYSKCSNPTLTFKEDAEIKIMRGNKIIAEFNSTNEIIDSDLSKIFASIGIFAGFKSEKIEQPEPPKPAEPKPEAGPGGSVDQHVGGGTPTPNEGTGSQAGQVGGGDSNGGAGASSESVGSGGAGE